METFLPIRLNKGIGQPLILLPGLGNNYKSWTYIIDNLNYHHYHVLALDLLGFGNAPKPNIDYTVQEHAKAVIATLDKQKITEAYLMGYSMGCLVAIEVAKQRPDIAKQLILLGAPLYKTIPQRRWWKRLLKIDGAYFTIFNFIKDNPDLTITAAKTAENFWPLLHGLEITEETWQPFQRSLANTVMQTESFKTVCRLNVSTLLIYGRRDVFVAKTNLKKAARQNRKHLKLMTTRGPHQITPQQSKKVISLLEQLNKKHN